MLSENSGVLVEIRGDIFVVGEKPFIIMWELDYDRFACGNIVIICPSNFECHICVLIHKII